ncbi:hypothetical protein acsn021_30930 [Anaerocolumna cellulosilytica]|uniref:Uncharacterized protein n=1 Tax=Anaerocolumna cellulosilytica TaxID=433286 RepID=A0A6S6QY13_9FIRM|nr:contractile injection system protein, VgrG/Pvc8 family [Anaerocolumna cellulosilytica]MBB5198004.1 hypothetical protein [Anaerocolumna cellulosilytica]BCJ95524.1 hypothetical protein acsn021_30930 [Anaerocolumna cellulosilytica]
MEKKNALKAVGVKSESKGMLKAVETKKTGKVEAVNRASHTMSRLASVDRLSVREKTEKNKEDKSETITYENLLIPSFELLHLEQFKIEQKIGQHAVLTFSGRLPEHVQDIVVYYTTVGYQVDVYNKNGEEKELIFCGTVTDVRVANEGSIKELFVTVLSKTYLLDIYKVSKSYQNTSLSYKALIQGVLKNTQEAKAIISEELNNSTGEFILQYKETDWEFIKRMSARTYLGLIPEITSTAPRFYIGPREGGSAKEIEVLEYTAWKNIKEYQINQKNYISGINESDYITYIVKSHALLKLGSKVKFQKSEYYVKEVSAQMIKGVLIGTYHLCKKNGLKQKKYHNMEIAGISLNGSVASIQRDKVQINLAIDGKAGGSYYFPYSTMSASPDGSGWYCMPEQGDEIRVYFPNEEEKECYAISSVSSYTPQAGDASDRMSDPSVKYLRTADNKEIILSPSGIIINADDGKAMITLDNSGNITINGAKSIHVTAEEDVTITATKNINLYATENISIGGQSGTIVMEKDGNTKMTGEYILEN